MLGKITARLHDVDNLLERYREMVVSENKKQNLVSRRDVNNLLRDLVAESLLPLEWSACRLKPPAIDIGSGAGLPGIPLRIARPALSMILLEANRRKSLFLRKAVSGLELGGVEVVCQRAEEFVQDDANRGRFNTVLSRAAAPLSRLLLWSAGLLAGGGELIAWKGAAVEAELRTLDISGWIAPQTMRRPGGLMLVRFERGRE